MDRPVDSTFNLVKGVANEEVGALIVVLDNLDVINVQGADSRYTTGAHVLAEKLTADPYAREVFEDVFTVRRLRGANVYAPYIGELTMRVCAMAAEEIQEDLVHKWPYEHTQNKAWQELLGRIFDSHDREGLLGNFIFRMYVGEVQSNIPERAVFTQLAMEIYGDRMRNAWDGGAANNLHGKAILAPGNIFTDIHVTRTGSIEADQKLQLYLNKIGQRKNLVSSWTGIERLDDLNVLNTEGRTWNTDMELWSFVHSVRPDERVSNPERSRIHKQIASVRSDRIKLLHADLAQPLSLQDLGLSPHQYDFGIYSVALSQNGTEDRHTMERNADLLTAKDGLILVLDYMKPNPDNSNELVHIEQRDQFSLHGLIKDLSKPEFGYRVLAQFRTGRCRDVMAGSDWMAITSDVV